MKRLSKSDQTDLLDNGVLVPSGDSERIVPVENLTHADVKIAFTTTRIRTTGEQRALLARQKTALEVSTPDWYIHKRSVVVVRPTKLSFETLRRLVRK
jgi:hypothetical protein